MHAGCNHISRVDQSILVLGDHPRSCCKVIMLLQVVEFALL